MKKRAILWDCTLFLYKNSFIYLAFQKVFAKLRL